MLLIGMRHTPCDVYLSILLCTECLLATLLKKGELVDVFPLGYKDGMHYEKPLLYLISFIQICMYLHECE